jgi:hypothetical protein
MGIQRELDKLRPLWLNERDLLDLQSRSGWVPLGFTLCSMRSALCFREMAEDRLEEGMQALASGKDPGAVKR